MSGFWGKFTKRIFKAKILKLHRLESFALSIGCHDMVSAIAGVIDIKIGDRHIQIATD
jgi:hypothetical protein